jgi:hypothetical protein
MFPIRPATLISSYPFDPLTFHGGLTRSQFDGQRLPRPQHRITNRHTRRLFVHLDRRLVGVDSNNFTDELVVPYSDLRGRVSEGYRIAVGRLTNSYMLAPRMFSAITTGPETPNTLPN